MARRFWSCTLRSRAFRLGRRGNLFARGRREFCPGVLCASWTGRNFRRLRREDHALVLLLHTQNHMQEAGVGLRHLCDWAAFLRAEADGAFWPEFLDFLKEIGLLRFAEVLSKTCAMYLGAPLLDFAKDAPEELATGILEDILSGGNFGRRDETHSGSAVFLPSFRGEEKRQTKDTEALAEPA